MDGLKMSFTQVDKKCTYAWTRNVHEVPMSDVAQFKLNIPREVKDWLAEEAARNMRSQAAEIVITLQTRMRSQSTMQKADAASQG